MNVKGNGGKTIRLYIFPRPVHVGMHSL